MARTQTGQFPIGFRCNCAWQEDLDTAIAFTLANDFEAIDVSARPAAELRRVIDAGLRLGSVDLPWPWGELGAADQGERRAAADAKADYIREAIEAGARNFFLCAFPDDDTRPRDESFPDLVDGLGRLCDAVAPLGTHLVLEGYPGSYPWFPTFGCTPADLRLLFSALGDEVLGVNYDPSHLIRMGIDPVRFLEEFVGQTHHVHAKDTALLAEGLYDHGHLQPATRAKPHVHGGQAWRYTIPGQGEAPWPKLLDILQVNGYDGVVSIELEDEEFANSQEREQQGFVESRAFLETA